ncbi:RNA-binding S4 domain-containing protein [Paraglaciecola arctica]|uniref:RNA-binding S4 domain-containing protein n=1 Tax=Paraglaciecola arctica TaxID=1128911 RepID=UPI00068C2350|nr:RNA-binding S4 domain-containing protein [Paraglaciecola arctica]|tara:strand:+ start:481 stop:744 length:264 start_codon:yes stop_codon:yes gene_type:complete
MFELNKVKAELKVETGTTKNIEINAEPIALYQILKFEALVSSGGEAKAAIDDGRVLVNGEVETRRRKKIMSGDIVEFEGERFNVVLK